MQDHRRSRSASRYFLTFCTAKRRVDLTPLSAELIELVRRMDATGDAGTYAFVVMPDHCHWVLWLGERLSLDRVVAKFKSLSVRALRSRDLAWQRNYYERELRADETPEDFCLYAFLNPYRAGLPTGNQRWPGWWTGAPHALRFLALIGETGMPPQAWLDLPVPMVLRGRE